MTETIYVRHESACPGCGLEVARGAEGCLELYWERIGNLVHTTGHDRHMRLAWDTYCVQHPDRYCISAKSLIAHLSGLCWAIEYGGHITGYQALSRVLNGTLTVPKPQIPLFHGTVTIADVPGREDANAHAEAIERWGANVWEAYRMLHSFARRWIETALSSHL